MLHYLNIAALRNPSQLCLRPQDLCFIHSDVWGFIRSPLRIEIFGKEVIHMLYAYLCDLASKANEQLFESLCKLCCELGSAIAIMSMQRFPPWL